MIEISKTQFKEFSKCKYNYGLDKIYHLKNKSGYEKPLYNNILSKMFDEEGNDLISKSSNIDIMLPFYKKTEEVSMRVATKTFNKKFSYEEDNTNQKEVSFIDDNGYKFYTYLDGYHEDDKEIIIIEVKATTSNSFKNLGPTVNKTKSPIFKKKDNIYELDYALVQSDKKYSNYYSKIFDRFDENGKYIYDIAVTSFIVNGYLKENSINKKVRYYLAVLNSDYEYDGYSDYDICDGEEVINFIDVTQIIGDYRESIYNDYLNVTKNFSNNDFEFQFSKSCKEDCVFKNVCFPFLKNKDNITTLMIPKSIKVLDEKFDIIDLINRGYYNVTDIPYEFLNNESHIIQRNALDNDEIYINKDKIKQALDNIVYPIYHLDFEAFQSPLPRFYKEKPYMQSVFQFSIHIEKEKGVCDEVNDNYYFLPSDFSDQREELIKKMIEIIDLSKGGTVLVYNKNFECSRIKEFMHIYPQYKKDLQNIYDHIFDLLDVIRKSNKDDGLNYYHKNLHGSYSIKKVLPIFSELSYENLSVRNGVEASSTYASFASLPQEDIEECRAALIKYCGQDTYSMVIILNKLYELIE